MGNFTFLFCIKFSESPVFYTNSTFHVMDSMHSCVGGEV